MAFFPNLYYLNSICGKETKMKTTKMLKKLLALMLSVCMISSAFTLLPVSAAENATSGTAAVIKEIVGQQNNPLDYAVGEDIVFKFHIYKSGTSTVMTAPYLHYSAVMDDGRTLTGYVEPDASDVFTVTLAGGLKESGFVMMTVKACNANKGTLSNVSSYMCGAGAGIDGIQSVYGKPDAYDTFGDFETFWENTLAPMDAESGSPTIKYIYYAGTVTTDGVTFDCYELEINCPTDSYYNSKNSGAKEWCGTNYVSAFLTIPQGQTNLGLSLNYKGYDWISASGSHTSIAPQDSICTSGKITLSVSPHSVPAPHNVAEADKADTTYVTNGAYNGDYYKSGGYLSKTYGYMSTHGKNLTDNADPNTTYFKYMIMRDVQAARFLMKYFAAGAPIASNDQSVDTSAWAGKWNGTDVKTSGSSQGGYQAIAVAGLVPQVNEVSAGVPWFGDQGVESKDSTRYKPTAPRGFGYCEGLRYVDTANFAANVSSDCNMTITAGLIDTLVPPSTIMSIYDNLKCDVTLNFCQNQGHGPNITNAIYYQQISKAALSSDSERYINFVGADSSFTSEFAAAWTNVSEETVVTTETSPVIDVYVVDKNTTVDFKTLASTSTADAIGVVLTGTGLDKINDKLAEIWALSNDASSKVWVIGNSETANAENSAIALDACMNGGDRSTVGGKLELYGAEGKVGQSFLLGKTDTVYAIVPTPLWAAGQVVWTETENVTMAEGKMKATADEGTVNISTNALKAEFDVVGALDADAYGNIDGVGFWLYDETSKTLTVKGAGDITAAPWADLDIAKVELSEGIAALGANTFNMGVVEVTLPTTITAIDSTTFAAGSTVSYYDNCAAAKAFAEANASTYTFTNAGATGTCGTDLNWIFNVSTGVLTIDGTGTTVASGSGGWTSDNSGYKKSVFWPYHSQIKKIVIGDSVTTVNSNCFYAVSGVTEVEISKNLTTINSNAFGGCSKLTTINVRDAENTANAANLQYVTSLPSGYQFDGAKALKNVILSDKLTGSLGDKIFCDTGITSLVVPAGVSSLAARALHHYSAKTPIALTVYGKDTVIPDNFLKTDNNAATLSKIYTVEGSSALAYAQANSISYEIVEAPEVVIASGTAGVDLNWKITDVDGTQTLTIYGTGTKIQPFDTATEALVPSIAWDTVQTTYEWAPYYGTAKKLVIEAPNVDTVMGYAFGSFDQIHTVELAETITMITGGSSFNSMAKLATVYSKGQTPVTGTANLSNILKIDGYTFAYALFDKVIFADNVTTGDWTFTLAPNLTEVTLPKGSKFGTGSFGSSASAAKKVTTVTYDDELATVSYLPFRDYSGTANTGVKTIIVNNPEATFEGCTGDDYTAFINGMTVLATVKGYTGSTAEAFVTKANEYFASTSNSRRIEFIPFDAPPTVVATGNAGENLTWTITEESGIKTMTISGTGTKIEPYDTVNGYSQNASWDDAAGKNFDWYDYRTQVQKLVIEAESVTSIEGYTFAMFSKVETLELPATMTALNGDSCFNSMESLKTVYQKGQTPVTGTANLSGFTKISGYAFVQAKFDKIIFADNVTVNSHAFTWNQNLTEVTVPNGSSFSTKAFGGYTGTNNRLATVIFADEVSTVKYTPFYDYDYSYNTGIKTIVVNNPDATFEGCTNGDYSAYLNGMKALTTVKGYIGSTADTFVKQANAYFAENSIDRALTFVPLDEMIVNDVTMGENLWFRIIDNKDGTSTMMIYGTGTELKALNKETGESIKGGYANSSQFTVSNYYEYRTTVTKVYFDTPNLASTPGYFLRDFSKLTTLQFCSEMTSIPGDTFNGLKTLTTVYTSGQTPVEGTANFSNFTSIGGYTFYQHKFKNIILGDGITTLGTYVFGSQSGSVLESVEIPASVTKIDATAFVNANNLVYIKFNGSFTYANNSFSGIAARATVIAPKGTTGETLAAELGVQYIDSAAVPAVDYYYYTGNSVMLLSKQSDGKYTAFATGSATSFALKATDGRSFDGWSNAVNKADRPWNDYKSNITKLIYVNPALTAIDASFAVHANIKTVEIPASVVKIGSNAFNGTKFTTLYVAGNTPETGVCDFRNITAMGDMCLASCASKSILLNDALTGSWGNNLFYNCDNITYIRIPKGITSLGQSPFWSCDKLATVLFENPATVISDIAFKHSDSKLYGNLKTVIGYPGSTAQTFAEKYSLEFVPITADGLLGFDGFQVRTDDYNGLRSLYNVNLANINALTGLSLVEFGSLLASSEKLGNDYTALAVAKDSDGEYSVTGAGVKLAIYKSSEKDNEYGGFVGNYLTSDESKVTYACTVTRFTAANYSNEVTTRGYIVLSDAEGHEYIVYADIFSESDPSVYAGSMALDTLCYSIASSGLIDETNISYNDVLRFAAEAGN